MKFWPPSPFGSIAPILGKCIDQELENMAQRYLLESSDFVLICQGTKSDHCFAFSVPRSINQSLPFVNFRLFFQEHKYPGVEMGDTRKRANGVNAEISSFFVGTPRAKFIYYIAHPCSGQHPSQGWVPCGNGQGAIASAFRPAAMSPM